MKYIVISKSIGLLLIILGTLIVTAKIPSIDKTIESENESIEKFEGHRILAGISILKASHISNQNRLFLMEANIAGYTGQGRKRQIELRQNALNQTITEIRNWNSLFSKGERSEFFQGSEKEIQSLLQNEQITIEQKNEKLEQMLSDTRIHANERLKSAYQKRNDHKERKGSLERSRSIWNTIFLWFQILGIFLLSGSEILEKIFIKTTHYPVV